MVKVICCNECYKIAEIRSDNETDLYDEPSYCPFCGAHDGSESTVTDEEDQHYSEYEDI